MKRKFFLLVLFIQLFILFIPIKILPAHALGEDSLNESIEEMIGELDLKELEIYVESLGAFGEASVAEKLLEFIKGENFEYANFWGKIGDIIFEKVKKLLPSFACVAAIALLSGIIGALKGGVLSKTTSDMVFFSCYAAALIPVCIVLTECFSQTVHAVDELATQMQLVYPIMLTLTAASGGAVTASVCRPAVSFFASTIITLLKSVVLPISVIIIVFSMAGNLTKELKLNKFTAFFKSLNKWIIGIAISVFGLFFSLQGLTASSYDGIIRRTAKYAIGTGVPIVGGFLSGGFDLAVAGSVLIKNSLGSIGIFLLIAVLIEPILFLVATNILLRFTSAITQPIGDNRISDFLGETADNLNYFTASLLFASFLYFVSIIVLISFSEALF